MTVTAFEQIKDWDDAYANKAHIEDSDRWPDAWLVAASEFRAQAKMQADIHYGAHQRQRYDLFHPTSEPQGLFVFVHGGYWIALDKSYWSHLAQGALDSGWAVAIPSYVLCPEASIENIAAMTADAVTHAANMIAGPIVLSGHSAGGHLVTSMLCENSALEKSTQRRIQHVVSISGVHDLRPLLKTEMNTTLKLDTHLASELSPVLSHPVDHSRVTAWVGGKERPEFIRQSELICNIWHGLGVRTQCVIQADKHHFDVIDDLALKDSALMNTILER